MFRLLGAASVLSLSAIGAPTALAAQQQAQPQPQAEKLICKGDRFTGSRIATRRRCRTAAQWQADERDAHDISQRAIANRETRAPEHLPNSAPTVGGAASSNPFIPPRN